MSREICRWKLEFSRDLNNEKNNAALMQYGKLGKFQQGDEKEREAVNGIKEKFKGKFQFFTFLLINEKMRNNNEK